LAIGLVVILDQEFYANIIVEGIGFEQYGILDDVNVGKVRGLECIDNLVGVVDDMPIFFADVDLGILVIHGVANAAMDIGVRAAVGLEGRQVGVQRLFWRSYAGQLSLFAVHFQHRGDVRVAQFCGDANETSPAILKVVIGVVERIADIGFTKPEVAIAVLKIDCQNQ